MNHPMDQYRELFPVTQKWIYFNHAATAPYSTLTAEAMERYIRDLESCGGVNYEKWDKIKEEARELVGRLLACGQEEVALISNTSEGANIVAQGLELSPGDNIVVPEHEFPANVYPWLNLQQKGIEIRFVSLREGRVLIQDIMSSVDRRTRLVAVSSVAYHNGFRLDLESLGNRLSGRGIPLYVDAIQSLGVIPMDVKRGRIAFLSADGHKWLLAPEGAALFYCSSEHLSLLKPAYVSWLSVREPFRFESLSQELAEDARRFECGTPNYAGIAGLHQSLKTLLEIGIERIMRRVLYLTDLTLEGLRKKGYRILTPLEDRERSGILAFDHPNHSTENLAGILQNAKVVITVRGGGVRISPHFYNNEEEVERFLDALP